MKKVISVTLCILILAGMLCGCSKKASKKVTLREDLLEYGGDFWTKENKKTAERFVTNIEKAYNAYQKDRDLDDYADKICTIVDENQAFVDEVVEALRIAEEDAKAKGDFDAPLEIFKIKLDMMNIGARKTDILLITELGIKDATDAELEQTVHTVVNWITGAFCDKEIAG